MEWWVLTLVLFGGLFLFIATGVHVAAGFGLLSMVALYVLEGARGPSLAAIGMFRAVAMWEFVAFPLFVLMGSVVMYAGFGSTLLEAVNFWLGRVPGRLAVGTTGANALFGAMCGSSTAACAAIGSVMIPEMVRRDYDKGFAAAVVAAGGNLSLLIPPSAYMVVYGAMAETDVGKLLLGGVGPGLLLTGGLILVIIVMVLLNPALAPSHHVQRVAVGQLLLVSLRGILPVLVLLLSVMGVIFWGIATPGEAAAVGALGAFGLAAAYRRLSRHVVKMALKETVKVSSMIFLIVASAKGFSQVLALTGIVGNLKNLVVGLQTPVWVTVMIMLAVVLVLGMFIDPGSILFLTLPVTVPVVTALSIDPVWFGVLYVLALATGNVTPPFGLNIFVSHGLVGDIPILMLYRRVVPFSLLHFAVIALVVWLPGIATWLPVRSL